MGSHLSREAGKLALSGKVVIMSRQLEQIREVAQSKADRALVAAIEYGLAGAVAHSGGDLLGYSVRCDPNACLVTLRVKLAGRRQVAFVGAGTVADALRKAVRLGNKDELPWRADRYEKKRSLTVSE